MEKKYILTDETKEVINGRTLHRIKAVRSFSTIKEGDLGGWVERYTNLSHDGDCWVFENACVFESARVSGHAKIFGDAQVFGNAKVYGHAEIFKYAKIFGRARVFGYASILDYVQVCGNTSVFGAELGGDAEISRIGDYIVFKNFWSSGRQFAWTRSNNMWRVGCFYGTGEELITKAYADSDLSGREYERVVRYVESILKDEEEKK